MLHSGHAARAISQLTFLQQKISVAYFHDYLIFVLFCFKLMLHLVLFLSSTSILIVFMWEKMKDTGNNQMEVVVLKNIRSDMTILLLGLTIPK